MNFSGKNYMVIGLQCCEKAVYPSKLIQDKDGERGIPLANIFYINENKCYEFPTNAFAKQTIEDFLNGHQC